MKINGITIGSILGFLAVILGAFGAHLLKDSLSASALNSYETGVRFQMYHAIVFLVLGFFENAVKNQKFQGVMKTMLLGIILFSGSIYLLSTREMTGLDSVGFLGPITPIGGTLLIVAWGMLMVKGIRGSKDS